MALAGLDLFATIVAEGSLTAAAERMGLSKSTVSKRLAALERRLGTRLLERTTRAMRLTEDGRRYHARAVAIVDAARAAELELSRRAQVAVGRIRVSAPVSFGTRFLGRPIARFVAAHPEVEVEVDLTDRYVDLIAEGYEVAIRAGPLEETSLVARKLLGSRSLVVAAPAYLDARGRPRSPAALARHDALLYRHQRTGATWRFEGPGGVKSVRVSGRLQSDNGDLLADAACEGIGVALLPDFIVAPYLADGRLEAVLDAWCRSTSAVHAVYPSRHLSAGVRLFVEAIAEALTAARARRARRRARSP